MLQGSSGEKVLVGNYIGVDDTGMTDEGNGAAGVYINGAPDVVLRDNVISGNDTYGVHINGSGAKRAVIFGNTIGLNADGTADLGNAMAGVYVNGAEEAILRHNIISGNDTHGINLSGSGARNADIQYNLIGVNASATLDRGNTGSGIHISGPRNIGIYENVIGGNDSHGVSLTSSGTMDTFIGENYIGTNSGGTSLGNGGSGVHIASGSYNNFVEVNTIANNTGDGVTITATGTSLGNTVWEDSIHNNGGLGIDLGDDGATANDTGDVDAGPNFLQNFPTNITFATRGDVASVSFTLGVTVSRRYIVDFYSCDSSSSGEGKQWLGFTRALGSASGERTFTASTFRGQIGDFTAPTATHITATATDTLLNATSEFAPCVALVDLPELDLSVDEIEVTEDSTTETTYTIALASEPSDTTRVQIVVLFASRSNIVNPTTGYPYTLVFTTSSWDHPIPITVFGVSDNDALHEANEIRHQVPIGGSDHITAIVPVEVTDDDAPTLILESTTTGVTFPSDVSVGHNNDGVFLLNEGDTATYTVKMEGEPDGDVTVDTSYVGIYYAGGDEMSVSPASIMFTKTGEASDADKWEWDDPQTVTITALNDPDPADEYLQVRHEVTVSDEDYVVAQLAVATRELGLPSLTFDPSDRNVNVNEGATATYTVALASDPGDGATATVEIRVEIGPFENAIYVWQDELPFTGGASGNWGTPQEVTVTGENDDDEFDDLPELEHILIVGPKTALRPTVYVTVVDGNRAPYFVEGTDATRSVPETAGAGTIVGDPVEALDLNTSDTLTYELEDPSGLFAIDSGGQITVASDNSLDFETEQDYEVEVSVSDRTTNGLTDKIEVKVRVIDVNEPPVIRGDASPTFSENANISNRVARYTARGPEGDTSSFTWSVEGSDRSEFNIDTSGNLKFNSQLDHETKDTYDITIVATDATDMSNIGALPVTVEVNDVDEPSEIAGDTDINYDENADHPVAPYAATDPEMLTNIASRSLGGTDSGDFTIDSAGLLQFANTPNFESPTDSGRNNFYNVQVRATDDATSPKMGTLDVTVIVKGMNEAPTTSGDAELSFPEGTSTTRVLDRYSASDPERSPVTWTLNSRAGNDADAFRIDSSGNLYFDGVPDHETPTDSGGNNIYEIQVVATDDGNLGDGSASLRGTMSASFDVAVTVTPVDEPPVITGTTTFPNWQENDDSTCCCPAIVSP